MCPVGTQSIWTIWKSSTRLADGREIVYFDEEPGLGRDQVADTRPLPPRIQARSHRMAGRTGGSAGTGWPESGW